jgi:hypothetical protein
MAVKTAFIGGRHTGAAYNNQLRKLTMKRIVFGAALALAAVPAFAQVGVSVGIGEPGFYGQINLGNGYPAPQVVNPQPVVIQPAPEYVGAAPIYLRVPDEHQRDWHRWCFHYNACGRPVYFVRDDWYRNSYAPAYHRDHGWHDDHHDDHRGYDRHDDHYYHDHDH